MCIRREESRLRIVVVDEDAATRSSLVGILRGIADDVQAYEGLCDAVRAMMRDRCHLLLLDIHQAALPCETALSLLHEVAPGVAVILVTPDPHGPHAARWIRAGVSRMVGKPIDAAEVLGAVTGARMACGDAPTSGFHPPYISS